MVDVTSSRTIYFFDIPYFFLSHALMNYVIHSKLELKFVSQNPHILLDPLSKLRFDESIRSRMFEFSWGSAITPTPYAYPNLLNKKTLTPFERKYHIVSATLLVFVDVGENLVMADDVATLSNPPVSLIEKEELEETLLDVNVSQRSCEEKPSKRMVRTRVDHSAWDHRWFPTHMA